MSTTISTLTDRFDQLDRRTILLLRRWSPLALRLALGVVFVWFGALKALGVTPVAELVARTVYWVDPAWLVPVLGVAEVGIGVGLIVGRGLRVVLALFALQMAGTFLVLVVLPEVAFQRGNPFLLTVEGEFVVKNLVLLAAGMAVGAQVEARSRSAAPDGLGT
ncbi:MAG: DoxX family membrane protein [Candidatus Limnocylindria bacterium]